MLRTATIVLTFGESFQLLVSILMPHRSRVGRLRTDARVSVQTVVSNEFANAARNPNTTRGNPRQEVPRTRMNVVGRIEVQPDATCANRVISCVS